tara:strand:- start:28 stop:201 length:174 start_codon:yes stop_codon:yes gene_type:complete
MFEGIAMRYNVKAQQTAYVVCGEIRGSMALSAAIIASCLAEARKQEEQPSKGPAPQH